MARYSENRHRENCLIITIFVLLLAVILALFWKNNPQISVTFNSHYQQNVFIDTGQFAIYNFSQEHTNGTVSGTQPSLIREATHHDSDSPNLEAADVSLVGEDEGKEVLACSKENLTDCNGEYDFNDIESVNDTMTFEEVFGAVVEDAEKEGLACGKENVTDCSRESGFNDTESVNDGGAAITIAKGSVIVGLVNEGILQEVSTAF